MEDHSPPLQTAIFATENLFIITRWPEASERQPKIEDSFWPQSAEIKREGE
jgi:hypothetical protein